MDRFFLKLNEGVEKGLISSKFNRLIQDFYESYIQAIPTSSNRNKCEELFELLIQLVLEQVKKPHSFSIFHSSLRQPFDYYQFGLDFIRPFIDFHRSKIWGNKALKSIQEQLEKGENVILLANHQTEPDPQIISLLLEPIAPKLAEEMVFVAGHRVITDPMAIPMSLGRNLLCIYSKKHIAHPPEEKEGKILHNQRTLKQMQELLNEGSYCVYVAPSGGRDRRNAQGEIEVAPFDPQSLELFWLIGQQSKQPTHFYPLSLKTYDLMPPPKSIEKELGEKRTISYTPVYLFFGDEIDMEHFPGSDNKDKKLKRTKRADFIWRQVCQNYEAFP